MTVLDPLDDPFVVEHTNAIHLLAKRTIADVIEIGVRMAALKHRLGRPDWLRWLEREGCTEQTALNYMRTAELNESKTVLVDLELPLKALYLLAAPSTPPAVQDEIIARAEAGEPITTADVKTALAEAKPAPAEACTELKPEAEPTAITEAKPKPKSERRLDQKYAVNPACVSLFANEDQLQAFAHAVNTPVARKFIKREQHVELAKQLTEGNIRALHYQPWITDWLRQAGKLQGKIDAEERDDIYKQFPGHEIRDEVAAVKIASRAFVAALLKLESLVKKFPAHPFLGDIGSTLDGVINMIRQYRRTTGEKGDKLERDIAKQEETKRKIERQKIAIEELRKENEELRAKLAEAEKAQ